MDAAVVDVMVECAERSAAGTITFPEVVSKLMACGVESYHADLYRLESTHYMPDGESHVTPLKLPPLAVAREFSAEGVSTTVRAIQQGAIVYEEFMRRIAAAGVANYYVYLTGAFVAYVGRDGSVHIERFPGAR